MGEVPVTVRFDGPVAVVDLGPGKHQFTADYLRELQNALDTVLSEPSARAMVTVGQGKHFSNGIDLNWMMQNPDGVQAFVDALCSYWCRLMTFPLPTVAAVNGHAFAGGALLALMHDYRVMVSDRGWLCLPEVHISLPFIPVMMEMLRAKLPPGPARTELLLMGERYSAEDALRSGIAKEVTSEAQLLEVATRLAKSTLEKGEIRRDIMQTMKTSLYQDVVKQLGGGTIDASSKI